MTEAEIEAEVQKRLGGGSSSPLPEAKPARAQWESVNPGGDYDAAMKNRDAWPMSAPADDPEAARFAETRAKLLAAEKEIQNKSQQEDSGSFSAAKSIYNSLPEGAKPVALAATGWAAGKALRGVLPQEHVIGTPEYYRAQDQNQALAQSSKAADSAARSAIERQSILEQQRAAAQTQHQTHLDELNRAHMEHINAQALNTDEEIARRLGVPAGAVAKPDLTPQPRGGEATSNYALKHGATEAEARLVPSASAMQQQNIPAQQKAWEKTSVIAPEFDSYKEHPLLLGPEGKSIVRERLTKELQHKTKEEIKRELIRQEIARQKAEALLKYEIAQENARLSAKAALAASKAHEAHMATTAGLNEEANQKYQRFVESKPHPVVSSLAKIGTKVAGRFVPGVGSAFAPIEAQAAKEDWEAKNYGRAAAHGLGVLGAAAQSTGVPFLMGAGDIAQIPAAGLFLYDLFNEKPKN